MLTDDQRRILFQADRSGMIRKGDSDTCRGIHFCADWDQLPICVDSPEAEACTCGRLSEASA